MTFKEIREYIRNIDKQYLKVPKFKKEKELWEKEEFQKLFTKFMVEQIISKKLKSQE